MARMRWWFPLAIVGLVAAVCDAQESSENVAPKLVVGTKHSPPFALRNPDGEWTGISIEVWQQLANDLNLQYEWRELPLDELLLGLEAGELDAAVAAISVTAERHERVDFCHPHFTTRLGIAIPANSQTHSWTLLRRILSSRLLVVAALLISLVLCCGVLFWALERKCNESMFGRGRRQGIGMGVWWSTIILLGHKGIIPLSFLGRIVAACAMISSLLLLSLLTGIVASVLTVQQLETNISGPGELREVRVVTVATSTSADYLRRRRIKIETRSTAEACLQDLLAGRADVMVYDEALLKYLANTRFSGEIRILPVSFHAQDYAIALPLGSRRRKPLNEALLRFRAGDRWDVLVARYLGE